MELILEASGVSKKFGGKTALDEVSFNIPRGSTFGIIGRNGAGKTTLIKLILGFLRPTNGKLRVIGGRPGDNFARIGYLPEFPNYHPLFTGREYILYLAEMSGLKSEAAASRTQELLEMTAMAGEASGRRMANYSKGMLQKIGIAQALLNSPEFVVLDEPFSGLDPFAQKELRDIISTLKSGGATILICSHILSHLEKICDAVAVIHKGRIIRHGGMASLLVSRGRYRLSIDNAPARLIADLIEKCGLAPTADGAYIVEEKSPGGKEAILKALIDSGAFINGLSEARMTLDEFFNSTVSGREGE
ncbi:MAG TPA: ABC transporter ATP-binding protein [Candidatus Wallbacteria bacterium]|nr:MAG: putative ABC transporter ATP-binding protein YxlF [bacterium ADurb.Bin243]HOD39615.1 ABC transporter ATP-binding protein [Candidatus Wallbacteria bacterium]HPG56280.1 ABC transporter ATP-binding protein [Candidatus Wallbacteria bacterium]